MSFTNLKIQNFGLIREFESDFDNLGLVLVQGSNPESQVADSNDAGKTTLFEALLWGVWGKTIKGGQYKGKKVINWDADSAQVSVNFLGTDGKEYSIVRTEHRKDANLSKLNLSRGDTDLTQISKAETQALIDQLLGIDFLTFTHTIIFGQHQVERFASLTDAATKGIFSKILDFEHYELALAETKRRITATQKELDDISLEVRTYQMQIQRGTEFLEDAESKRDAFDEEKEARLLALRKDKKSYETKFKKLAENLPDKDKLSEQRECATVTLEEALKKRSAWRGDVEVLHEKVFSIQGEQRKIQSALDAIAKEQKGHQKELKHIESTDICPECETEITARKKAQLASKYKDRLVKTVEDVADLEEQMAQLKNKEAKASKIYNKTREDEPSLMDEIRERQNNLNELDVELHNLQATMREIKTYEDTVERLESEINRAAEETFNLEELINKETDKIRQAEKSLKTAEQSWKRLEKHMERLEFWREGFGNAGIKSLLTEQVVPFLNDRAEQFSKIITGGEVKITFKAQTQLKSGEFRERFGHDIELIGGGKDSCYDATGGGFRRRTDLVIAFALRDLIMSQSSYKPNMIVYDECFPEVDETGCEVLFPFLEDQADEIGTVFVITHDKKLAAQFPNIWRVTRDGKKSIVEVL